MYHLTETMPVSKKSISLLRALYESNYTFYGTVSDERKLYLSTAICFWIVNIQLKYFAFMTFYQLK